MMKKRAAIFQSVFPSSSQVEPPTPNATPQIGTGSFRQSDSGTEIEDDDGDDDATRQIQWERAWHTCTASLTFPSAKIPPPEVTGETKQMWHRQYLPGFRAATLYLARYESLVPSYTVRRERPVLIEWYQHQVTRHFTEFQLPTICEALSATQSTSMRRYDDEDALTEVIQLLSRLQEIYCWPVEECMSLDETHGDQHLWRFVDHYRAMVSKSMASTQFTSRLTEHIRPRILDVLDGDPASPVAARELEALMDRLQEFGLGGAQSQQVFAEILDEQISLHIRNEYSWPRASGTGPDGRLPKWVREVIGSFVRDLSGEMLPEPSASELDAQIEDLKKRGIHELAARRLSEAFGIVLKWDDDPNANLSEISTFLHTAPGRVHVANKLIRTINHRLLIPGAATIEILRVYVNTFLAFLEVDRSGLLLARIIRPIRRYLRDRDDTVKIIIQALLLDHESSPSKDEALNSFSRLVQELHDPAPSDDGSDPLYDFTWNPDPIDATPDWKADERPEIFSKLIDIFENKDIFVKEFQEMLGTSLLRGGSTLDQEIRVLELFKNQIGEAHLQACEVMIKDITDSGRADRAIKEEQKLSRETDPQITAKILSRFYWPSLDREHMLVPRPVEEMQVKYSAGFETYNPSRKLTWLQNLGQAKVELHLTDRTVSETVHTWQASVIYAFSGDSADGTTPVRKTAEQVVSELQMDDELVDAALAFWVSKRVLQRLDSDYVVLEELPSASDTNAAGTAQPSRSLATGSGTAAPSGTESGVGFARRRDEAVAEEKMAIFWQYTANMLTNQGPMPLQRIVMMLKLVVPGGFPYSNDEFRAHLARRVESGTLEVAGGNYRIAK